MTRPEDAAGEARRRSGDYAGDRALQPTELDDMSAARISSAQLREWALIEIDPATLRSTRRLGAPVTALKRMLLRLLRQYTVELEAHQTRFNIALLARLDELEERTLALEREREREA